MTGPLSVLRAAVEEPGRIAVVDAGREVSFRELAGDVRHALDDLEGRGIGPSTRRAALVGESRYENLVLFFALAELGVPAVVIHPRSTAAERRRELDETASEVLLEAPLARRRPVLERELPPAADPELPLAILRTSGSGGRPRWIVLSRRAFTAAAAASARNLGWRDDDRWLLSLPIAHVGGLSILTRCLAGRRAVVLEAARRFEARAVAETVDRRRVTLVSLVPTMLGRLLDLRSWRPPPHLRAMLIGGAAAPAGLLERAAGRGWPILATYGLTEACSQVATWPYAWRSRGCPGCGPPVAGMEVRIRDGVIEVRGPNLLSGYLPPSKPPLSEDGWFRTGDLGALDGDGHLHVLGRRDDVLVSGGENVEPAEVEDALNDHPSISASCVFGLEDAEWGQKVAAAVVAPENLDVAELADFLDRRLAPHKRPRALATLAALPEGALGKIDRAAAARLAAPLLRPVRYPRSPRK